MHYLIVLEPYTWYRLVFSLTWIYVLYYYISIIVSFLSRLEYIKYNNYDKTDYRQR